MGGEEAAGLRGEDRVPCPVPGREGRKPPHLPPTFPHSPPTPTVRPPQESLSGPGARPGKLPSVGPREGQHPFPEV